MIKAFYTTGEIAKIIGISEKTVKNYCTAGKIIAETTPITNYRRISHENLVHFMTIHGIPLGLLKQKKPLKILIVDDEECIVKLFSDGLREIAENAIIDTALDGYEACIKAGILIPDLILLDLNMPKLDGFDVCRTVRAHEETKHAKIIIITAFVTEDNLEKLQEFNPIGVYMKPFDFNLIMGKIRYFVLSREKH